MPSQLANPVVCLVTAPRADASRLASAAVGARLAACVNIIPAVQSVYRWKGEVEQDDEALLVLKTTRAAVAHLEEMLRETHPYDTFELIALDIVAGSRAYIEWIAESVERAS
jgi:periplasmic divalent cation tolerance protein